MFTHVMLNLFQHLKVYLCITDPETKLPAGKAGSRWQQEIFCIKTMNFVIDKAHRKVKVTKEFYAPLEKV